MGFVHGHNLGLTRYILPSSAATASLLTITYGHKVNGEDDPLVDLAESVMSNLAEVMIPGRYLVDAFPFRERVLVSSQSIKRVILFLALVRFLPKQLPGASFLRKAEHSRQTLDEFMNTPFQEVRNKMVMNRPNVQQSCSIKCNPQEQGQAIPSFTSNHLENKELSADEDELELLKWTAGGMYAGSYRSYSYLIVIINKILPVFSGSRHGG